MNAYHLQKKNDIEIFFLFFLHDWCLVASSRFLFQAIPDGSLPRVTVAYLLFSCIGAAKCGEREQDAYTLGTYTPVTAAMVMLPSGISLRPPNDNQTSADLEQKEETRSMHDNQREVLQRPRWLFAATNQPWHSLVALNTKNPLRGPGL